MSLLSRLFLTYSASSVHTKAYDWQYTEWSDVCQEDDFQEYRAILGGSNYAAFSYAGHLVCEALLATLYDQA